MTRTFVLGFVLAALALPAAAASVKVDLTNLDAKAIHTKIAEAADKVCRAEILDTAPLEQEYGLSVCISDTTAAAEAKLAQRRSALAKL